MAATIEDTLRQINKLVGFGELDEDPDLLWIANKYHVKPSFFTLGLCILIAVLLTFSRADRLVVCVACSVIPAYFTFLALVHQRKPRITKYLTYWPTFIVMEVASPLMSLIVPPHFWVFVRVLITAYLLNPKFNGAERLYTLVLEPFVRSF